MQDASEIESYVCCFYLLLLFAYELKVSEQLQSTLRVN